jgi:hypothetical protein
MKVSKNPIIRRGLMSIALLWLLIMSLYDYKTLLNDNVAGDAKSRIGYLFVYFLNEKGGQSFVVGVLLLLFVFSVLMFLYTIYDRRRKRGNDNPC